MAGAKLATPTFLVAVNTTSQDWRCGWLCHRLLICFPWDSAARAVEFLQVHLFSESASHGGTTYPSTDLCMVRTENWAVLGMRAPYKVGAKHRTQSPRTASFKFLTWCKVRIEFGFHKQTAVICLRGKEAPYTYGAILCWNINFTVSKAPFTYTRKILLVLHICNYFIGLVPWVWVRIRCIFYSYLNL